MDKIEIRDLTYAELGAELERMGEPRFRAKQVFSWLYAKGATRFEEFTDLSRTLRVKLETRFDVGSLEVGERIRSRDGAEKFLFRLRDGNAVESVLIPSRSRATVCLSTQVGCRFACAFCASGLHGFKRNLAPSEITGQVLHLIKVLGREPTNFVFMGMGEPLDNWENLEKALRIMNAPEGLGIAARRMTVSTAGHLPGIARFGKLDLQVNLSVSLHAVTDRLRSRLMPINRKYPLEDLVGACEDYTRGGGRMITLEYVVIAGTNDSLNDADGLAGIARRLKAKVNLIAYSPVPNLAFETPSEEGMARFRRLLDERKVHATLRRSKGGDIAAACGQLAGRFLEITGAGSPGRDR
jgi:23S rRNA (adenine2503-C2)-methyltransferase